MRKSKEYIEKLFNYYFENGAEKTVDAYSISYNTLDRYKRDYYYYFGKKSFNRKKQINKLLNNLTDNQIKEILNPDNRPIKPKKVDFTGKRIKFAHITDTHIGSKYFDENWFDSAIKQMKKENIDFCFHTGDIVEGMSGRAGHIYELSHLGYQAQKEEAVKQLSKIDFCPIFGIDGNHDRWFKKSAGCVIGLDLQNRLDNFTYLGADNGVVNIAGCEFMLWHGEDGSSYAHSYRLQKLVEAFQGGEKPNILLAGHTHKQCYIFERNVQVLSGGALSRQSGWMKSTRKPNHSGFWIAEAVINGGNVVNLTTTWYPFYK